MRRKEVVMDTGGLLGAGAGLVVALVATTYQFATPVPVMHVQQTATQTECQKQASAAVAVILQGYGVHTFLKTDPLTVANDLFTVRDVTTIGAYGSNTILCTGVIRYHPEALEAYDFDAAGTRDFNTVLLGGGMGMVMLQVLAQLQDVYPMEMKYRVLFTDGGGRRIIVDHDPIGAMY